MHSHIPVLRVNRELIQDSLSFLMLLSFASEDKVHNVEECILLLSPQAHGNFSMSILTHISNGVLGFVIHYLSIYMMLFIENREKSVLVFWIHNLEICICIFPCIGFFHDFKDFVSFM